MSGKWICRILGHSWRGKLWTPDRDDDPHYLFECTRCGVEAP